MSEVSSPAPSAPLATAISLVTGATGGIGAATARGLAALGATVLVHGRDPAKGEAIVKQIVRATGNTRVRFVQADLASLADVRRLALELDQSLPRLDVLVLNAAVACAHRELTQDGYEKTFAVNHLSHFLLTKLLHRRLADSAAARIVVVASEAHRRAHLDFSDLMLEREYGQLRAYSRSKLANLLFTRALAQRLSGTSMTCNALHPGVVQTGIFREAPTLLRGALAVLGRWLLLSPEQGAATSLYLATDRHVAGHSGEYYIRSRPARPAEAALDGDAAEHLWAVSERQVAGFATGASTPDAAHGIDIQTAS